MILQNTENYGPYLELATRGKMKINTKEITKQNWRVHLDSILNIMKDGIETDFVQSMMINITFKDGMDVDLSIFDYFVNLIKWHLIIFVGDVIDSNHLFFKENITRREIKKYIDTNFIEKYTNKVDNIELNNIIDDSVYEYTTVDLFSYYLANTINIEDDIKMMKKYPEYYDLLHTDLTGVPVEDVKRVGMERTERAIEYIKNSDHCLSDSFRAAEGISEKQYKEYAINIGSKPDGRGGIFSAIINKSFLNGGVNNVESLFIESSVGRTAQLITKMNVGSSGSFARLLNLNTRDTILHHDPTYACDSKNFIKQIVRDEKMLRLYENRFYRLDPKGMEYKLSMKDLHLVGKTIYLRSPMTCASSSRNTGVCYRCYGDLAYINRDINIGIIAAELLSAALTQRLLSAKHLLESLVQKLEWSKRFYDFFNIDFSAITLLEDMDYKGHKIVIDPDNITLESEDDNYEYNEYITSFDIELPSGKRVPIFTADGTPMYISMELNELIRKFGEPVDGYIKIDMTKLTDTSNIFMINILNDELSKTLKMINSILNKEAITTSYDINEILQVFLETSIEGGINIMSVHAEVILSCQLRCPDDILLKPDWSNYNEPYLLMTLNRALTNNPSVTISMLYQKLSKTLFNPLTFRKNSPSFVDLLFMENPQSLMVNSNIIADNNNVQSDKEKINNLVTFM